MVREYFLPEIEKFHTERHNIISENTLEIINSAKSYKSHNAFELLALINERLWIGHFDITSKNGIPAFRHTLMEPAENDKLYHLLEDIVDIGIFECERYYPAFQLVLFDNTQPITALELSVIDTIGRA